MVLLPVPARVFFPIATVNIGAPLSITALRGTDPFLLSKWLMDFLSFKIKVRSNVSVLSFFKTNKYISINVVTVGYGENVFNPIRLYLTVA